MSILQTVLQANPGKILMSVNARITHQILSPKSIVDRKSQCGTIFYLVNRESSNEIICTGFLYDYEFSSKRCVDHRRRINFL